MDMNCRSVALGAFLGKLHKIQRAVSAGAITIDLLVSTKRQDKYHLKKDHWLRTLILVVLTSTDET